MDPIKIYSSARCPYAQRTRMLMIEKELPFELTEVDLSNKPDWFLKAVRNLKENSHVIVDIENLLIRLKI